MIDGLDAAERIYRRNVVGVTLPDDLADLVRRLYLVDLNVESEQGPAIQGAVGASAPAVRCGVSC